MNVFLIDPFEEQYQIAFHCKCAYQFSFVKNNKLCNARHQVLT